MKSYSFLFWAYNVVWIGLAAYLFFLLQRMRRVDRRIEDRCPLGRHPSEHGRIAALNMAGRPTRFRGSLSMNVLNTLGLISSSFGLWMGTEGGDGARAAERPRRSRGRSGSRRRPRRSSCR